MDCNYIFPIDLAPIGILIGANQNWCKPNLVWINKIQKFISVCIIKHASSVANNRVYFTLFYFTSSFYFMLFFYLMLFSLSYDIFFILCYFFYFMLFFYLMLIFYLMLFFSYSTSFCNTRLFVYHIRIS